MANKILMHAGLVEKAAWWRTRTARWIRLALSLLILGVVAMVGAMILTPRVPVSAFGQTVQVGTVSPSLDLGWSGPGEADLFGEGTLQTVQYFDGPIRPRIIWQRFNRNSQASDFIQSRSASGHTIVTTGSKEVGEALAAGWRHYFLRLIVSAGLLGGALYLFSVGVTGLFAGRNHRHRTRRRHGALMGASVAASLVVTAAFTALTVTAAEHQLGQITSLSDLVGTAKLAPVPVAEGPDRSDVDLVVIGDSTAAGVGNTSVADPTPEDDACRRSSDAYAVALQSASGLGVINLGCSSATIANGLLGPQTTRGITIPSQVGVLKAITSAKVVVVSIGANDVGWSDLLRFCYGLSRCDDQASDSLFQSRLDSFKIQYTQLLQQLSDLPSHPAVIVNGYYNPFGNSFDCADLQDPLAVADTPPGYGFSADPNEDNQDEKIEQKIDPLLVDLGRLNTVIEQGAEAFGFTAVLPTFAGHELCTSQPWIQGLSDRAPFHPSAAGELAIAAADLPYIAESRPDQPVSAP